MERKNIYTWFFLIFLISILYGLYSVLKIFFIPLLWSAVIAVVFYPVYMRLNRFLKYRSNISSVLMTFFTTIIIIFPFVLLLAVLAIEAFDFYSSLEETGEMEEFRKRLSSLTEFGFLEEYLPYQLLNEIDRKFNLEEIDLAGFVSAALLGTTQSIVSMAQNIARNITLYTINFTIMLFALFFFFRDGERFYSSLIEAVPMEADDKRDIIDIFSKTINIVVLGNLAVAAVQGILVGLIFFVLGIGYPVLAGFISFVLAILPLVGSALVWLPVSVFLIFDGAVMSGVILMLFGLIVVSTSDNILRPVIIGKSVRLHTLFLFLTILGGIKYFGFSGILIGPLLLALFITILEIYKKKYLNQGAAT